MNKYNNRLNKLTAKTHDYFSYSEFVLIRDYWKARMDENNATVEKYEEACVRFGELIKASIISGNKKFRQEAQELYGSDENIRLVMKYQFASKKCADNLTGGWISKSYSEGVAKSLTDAKKFFGSKQKI